MVSYDYTFFINPFLQPIDFVYFLAHLSTMCSKGAFRITCCQSCIINNFFNPFPNKSWFLRVCSTSFLKTLWEKEKFLITSKFSFFHSVFYPFVELSAIFIPFEIVVCKLFQFGQVQNVSFGKGLNIFSSQTTWPVWTVPWEVLFQKLFTEFDSIQNSGCHGNEMEFFKQFF